MPSPSTLAKWEGLLIICGFFGIVFWKLANGSIALQQLLEGDSRTSQNPDDGSTYVSAGRTQSLLITLFVALYYLVQVIHNPAEFPELPGVLVAALAGSQALYLGGKARAMLLDPWRDFLK